MDNTPGLKYFSTRDLFTMDVYLKIKSEMEVKRNETVQLIQKDEFINFYNRRCGNAQEYQLNGRY